MEKDILYSELLNEWIQEHKMKIMESTAYNYEKALLQLKSYFGEKRVRDISAELIYNYVTYLRNSGLAITSTRLYCKVLQLSLNYAVKYHYIHYNPCKDVAMPKKSRAEIKPFTEREVQLLLTEKGLDWVKDGIMIAYRTGMRPGEIYALKWTDINFEQRFISVQRSISRASSKCILKTTKTASGVRRIDIDSVLIAHLRKIKENADGEFLFPGTRRDYRIPWNLSKYLKQMCIDAGITPRDFYSLRHTHATVLFAHGVHPKIVQERMGHSDIGITMGTYSHVSPTLQLEAVKVFEKIEY